jgi:uncharacterized protein (DUF362 family)/Pyruvate/2-oxoacid:ferredoxin oxidoreductase delta subunit
MMSVAPVFSAVACRAYDLETVRGALQAVLASLGGVERFVRPGMKVLLKPNLLNDAGVDRATTTHPAVVRAVAKAVQVAGGEVWIGDSPGGPISGGSRVLRATGISAVAADVGARLVPFDQVVWRRLERTPAGQGNSKKAADYFIAPPVFEADLVIDMPKLKTHVLTLFTGAVKNLYGVIPGTRKREHHLRAPGVVDFSPILVDVLELVRPGLSIMDGVVGLEGDGPGASGLPRPYGCLAASADPVALDAVIAQAIGCRAGEVLHLKLAGERGLGICEPTSVSIVGDKRVLEFGEVQLPRSRWYYRVPSWVSAPLYRFAKVRPQLAPEMCIGCGRCVEVCPRDAIDRGKPVEMNLKRCVGCMCCVEICPQGAITPRRSLLSRLVGLGR